MLEHFEKVLKEGVSVCLFLSGGRLRVLRTDFDDPDPRTYYAEHPDLDGVFKMFDEDCEKHLTYKERFMDKGHPNTHYYTGGSFINSFDQGLSYGSWYFSFLNGKFNLTHSDLQLTCEADSLVELINKIQEITRDPKFKYDDCKRHIDG